MMSGQWVLIKSAVAMLTLAYRCAALQLALAICLAPVAFANNAISTNPPSYDIDLTVSNALL